MRRCPHLRSFAFLLGALAFTSGCGSESDEPSVDTGPESKAAALDQLQIACADSLEGFYDAAAPPVGDAATTRGAVVRCAYDRFVTAAEMRAHFADNGYVDPGISTGAHKVRLVYWTERDEGEPVLTGASLYLPVAPVASPAPLLVIGHGSVGVADLCAPSKEAAEGFHKDWRVQLYTFAGDGWMVLQPDFPGLGTPGAATWMLSTDEGHAMLDATRAARRVVKPSGISDKNALLGHSNGGHAALSAEAYAKSYGSEGSIDAAVVFAPFWISNGAWGALISSVGNALITPTFLSMSMQYFRGHMAAYEGEDKANDLFVEDKRDAIGEFLEGACWQNVAREESGPSTLGLLKGSDAFTAEVVAEVGGCGLSTCESDLAKTWKARWTVDRPAPDPSIPIVLFQGAKDDFLVPGFQKCGIDRLEGQGADLSVCVAPEGDHSSLIPESAAWVRTYLRHKLLGGAAPEACVGIEALGADLKCTAPIPNAIDPSEP